MHRGFRVGAVIVKVASGQVSFLVHSGPYYLRMTGRDGTDDKGVLTQMQRILSSAPPDGLAGVRRVAQGGQYQIFVHLRTRGTVLPRQFHQAIFLVLRKRTKVQVPLTAVHGSGPCYVGFQQQGV